MEHRIRTVVRRLLLGFLVSCAGRSGILGEDDVIRNMFVVDQGSTDHAVVVEVFDDSGVAYSNERTLVAESDIETPQFDRTGEYEVAVTVDGNTTTTRHTFESRDRPIQAVTVGTADQGTAIVAQPSTARDLTTPPNRGPLPMDPTREYLH